MDREKEGGREERGDGRLGGGEDDRERGGGDGETGGRCHWEGV